MADQRISREDLRPGIILSEHVDAAAGLQMGGQIDAYIDEGAWFVSLAGNDTEGNGSFYKPFATLTKVCTLAAAGQTIVLMPGVYAEAGNVTVPVGVSVATVGSGVTFLSGPGGFRVSCGGGAATSISGLTIAGDLVMAGGILCKDVVVTGIASINAAAPVMLDGLEVSKAGGYSLDIQAATQVDIYKGRFVSTGNHTAIRHAAGTLNLFSPQISGGGTNAALLSSGGVLRAIGGVILASTGAAGKAIEITNGATSPENYISSVYRIGSVLCGTAVTIVDGLMGDGALSGTVITYRPAAQISYDDTFSIGADNVQDAIDAVASGAGPHTLGSHTDTDFTGIDIGDTIIWDGTDFVPGGGGGAIAYEASEATVWGEYVEVTFAVPFTIINSIQLTPDANVNVWYNVVGGSPFTKFRIYSSSITWGGQVSWAVFGIR